MSTARMNTRRALLRAALPMVGGVLLAACTRGSADLTAWVAEVKNRPPPPLEPLPVMQQFETFEYTAQDRRDPFSQPGDRQGGAGARPDPSRRRELLESVPLDSLSMVGTQASDGGMWALVMAPDRVVHRVRPGNYLGQNEGRITAVYEDRIELVELVTDGAGGWLERQAAIVLDDL